DVSRALVFPISSRTRRNSMRLPATASAASGLALAIACAAVVAQTAPAPAKPESAKAEAPAGDTLRGGFENPPNGARPRVWWHWMNGNISREGIKLDLEWMHKAGLGGYQNFDAAMQTPQVVPKRLIYMQPDWKEAFKYAITLGDQLGLEEAIAGSPGW